MPPRKRKRIIGVPDDLVKDVTRLAELKAQADAIDDEVAAVQARILGGLDTVGQKSLKVTLTDKAEDGSETQTILTATRVQNTRTVIDEKSLKTRLGATIWNKITSRVLDKAKLEAFIASGEIDPLTVADCSHDNEGAPYIRLTKK